jgi:putative spermidine/putrescine transport system substrate-binding protein
MATIGKLLVFSALLVASVYASAEDLVVVTYGGALQDAQNKAFYLPFEQGEKSKVVQASYNGEIGKIRAMVGTGDVTWDVVDVESDDAVRGCDEGIFEKAGLSASIPKSNLLPGVAKECGVGFYVWSTVIGYNGDKLKDGPKSWADFWNTKKFPGKRALRKDVKGNLEAALLADGVVPKDVYEVLATPQGVDRAFKKLDALKANLIWWDAGALPAQLLLSGDVVMASAYSGRLSAARADGKNIKTVWNGGIFDINYWVVPKGTKRKTIANAFINSTLDKSRQAEFAKEIAYGPVNLSAISLLDKAHASDLPTAPENLRVGLSSDTNFWIDHGDDLRQRFNAWLSK